jgi:hypothetical protein
MVSGCLFRRHGSAASRTKSARAKRWRNRVQWTFESEGGQILRTVI